MNEFNNDESQEKQLDAIIKLLSKENYSKWYNLFQIISASITILTVIGTILGYIFTLNYLNNIHYRELLSSISINDFVMIAFMMIIKIAYLTVMPVIPALSFRANLADKYLNSHMKNAYLLRYASRIIFLYIIIHIVTFLIAGSWININHIYLPLIICGCLIIMYSYHIKNFTNIPSWILFHAFNITLPFLILYLLIGIFDDISDKNYIFSIAALFIIYYFVANVLLLKIKNILTAISMLFIIMPLLFTTITYTTGNNYQLKLMSTIGKANEYSKAYAVDKSYLQEQDINITPLATTTKNAILCGKLLWIGENWTMLATGKQDDQTQGYLIPSNKINLYQGQQAIKCE